MKKMSIGGLSSRGWRPADLINDFSRAAQLLRNPRVPLAMKLLFPLAALIYWVVPTDLLPILPVDDIVVVLLALRAFVMLGDAAANRGPITEEGEGGGQVVDTTWRVIDE